MNLAAQLNRFPPALCRLLARKHNGLRSMSHSEVARKAGLSRSYVIKLSQMRGWERVPVRTVDAFATACGVNLMAPSAQRSFLKRRKLAYMARATPQERRMFGRLMDLATAR